MRIITLLATLVLASQPAAARTLEVGPGRAYATPAAAAAAARDGDRIVIAPGRHASCATFRAADLTIEAAPGGAVEITGPVCGGKALFVIAGPRARVIGITFIGAVAPPGNGAGIRAEGGDIVVQRSRFIENQNGILTASNLPQARILIEDSVFARNGAHLGDCAHGIYVTSFAHVAIHRTLFIGTRLCHHVKSRAANTEIIDSQILDDGDGRASYQVDIPNGGNLLLRNTELRKGPLVGNQSASVVIGAEGMRHPTTSLRIIDNRFTNLQIRNTVFVRNLSGVPAELSGNVLSGRVRALEGPGTLR